MIRYVPRLVDLTSNFSDLCTKVKVYIIIHKGVELSMHEGKRKLFQGRQSYLVASHYEITGFP